MKIQTSDLTGSALDWAVGLAEGHELNLYGIDPAIRARVPGFGVHAPWRPSYYWNQAGPIIEREMIATMYWTGKQEWAAKTDSKKGDVPNHFGATLLIAAMRCYVASKLGTEVDIPQELIK